MFQVTTFKEQHQAIFNLHLMSSSFSILIVSRAFQTILFYNAIDIADPSSIQDACAMSFVIDLAHRRVSVAQWQNIGEQNPKVWGSVPHGDSAFFFVSRSWQDEKHLSLYSFTALKTCHIPRTFPCYKTNLRFLYFEDNILSLKSELTSSFKM